MMELQYALVGGIAFFVLQLAAGSSPSSRTPGATALPAPLSWR
jgi:hypothetical protein